MPSVVLLERNFRTSGRVVLKIFVGCIAEGHGGIGGLASLELIPK